MATREQIAQALQSAHAAGNVEHARILAKAYQDLGKPSKVERQPIVSSSEFDQLPINEKLLIGTGKGAADVVEGITSLFGYDDPLSLGERSQQDKAISDSTPGKIGEVAGNIAATIPTLFIPGANTIKGASAIGAGTGYLTNKGDQEERLKNAGYGLLGGAVGSSLPYAYNLAEKVFAPLGSTKAKEKIIGNALNRTVGKSAPTVIQNLENAKSIIPGSNPTAAEVANSGGIAAFQRAMSDANPEAWQNRWMEQASARKNAIRSIAQDEQALQQAIAQRESAVNGDYANVHNQFIQSNPELEKILSTPSGQQAVAQAKTIAGNEYRKFGETVPTMQGFDSVSKNLGEDKIKQAAKHWTQQPINYEKDNILTAIRKLGGISKEMAQDSYGNEIWQDVVGNGLFRNTGGQSLDDLSARLVEHGYLPEGSGINDVVNALYSGSADDMFSHARQSFDNVYLPQETESDALSSQLKRIADSLESKGKAKPISNINEKSPYDVAYYGKDLHNIQRSLRDMAGNHNTDPVMRKSIKKLYDDYTKQLEDNLPGLLDVNKKYAYLSRPINQMQVGQELLNKIEPALAKHGQLASETGASYARALNDVRGNLVKNSTGGIKQKLEDVMTPEQMGILNGVAQDLARKAYSQQAGRNIGSNTFQNFAMNGIAEAAGIPSSVSGLLQLIPPTRYAMNIGKAASAKLYEGAEKEMKAMLADALLDPKETARLMKLAQQRGLLSGPRAQALPGLLGIGLANSLQQ